MHLSGLRSLGVVIHEEGGVIHCDGGNMHSGEVHLDYPSVGATENILMAAVLLPGISVIHNAAREPEIVDLANFINAMGGSVRGAGSAVMTIEGVKHLHSARWMPMPDRIVAGTLLAAGAITGGTIELTRAPVQALLAVNAKLREMGCDVREEEKTRYSDCTGALDSVCTAADAAVSRLSDGYAGADAGAAVRVRGTGVVVENVFENRFTHAGDLNRMGARILCSGRTAVVRGVPELYGARVTARDLRGGAALTLAGLKAQGETQVDGAELIDRGYEHFETQLTRWARISAAYGERIIRAARKEE